MLVIDRSQLGCKVNVTGPIDFPHLLQLIFYASVLIDGLLFMKLFHIDRFEKFLLTFNMNEGYLSL